MYDYTVFIGRFSPCHFGHLAVMKQALAQSNTLILLLGGAESPRTLRNPFTFKDRKHLIETALIDIGIDLDRVVICGINDHLYSDTNWITEVLSKVNTIVRPDDTIALIGHEKDHTSYYLKMFPQWDNIAAEPHPMINATDIRNAIYDYAKTEPFSIDLIAPYLKQTMTENMVEQLFAITDHFSSEFVNLIKEYQFILSHKAEWENTPYPVIFQTVDAIVECAGHILLVQRRNIPGKNLWAFPGGYLNAHETTENGMLRELREETKINISKEVLRKSILDHKRYDFVSRSERGRLITEAYHISLSAMDAKGKIDLPKIKGSDDAAKAKWFTLETVTSMREQMFEDHFDILEDMIGFSKEFEI